VGYAFPVGHSTEGVTMLSITPYAAPSTWDGPFFSQPIKVSGAQTLLFISGQVDWDEGNPGHPGDFKAQAHEVFRALKAQVEAGGGTMANLVKVNMYLTDLKNLADLRAIREEYLGKKMPAATMVVVQSLYSPDALIEVEGMAVL
jgi:2-iminobutanoate/2-iminopropanoate deaminase